jgi:hypothetical protein
VRGTAALVCGECGSNPWHRACGKDLKYVEVCPTCSLKSVKAWTGASAGTSSPSEIIDLTGGVGGGAEVAWVPENGAQQDAVPAVGGGVRLRPTGRRRVWELVRFTAVVFAKGARTLAQHGGGAGEASPERVAVEEADAEGRASASAIGEGAGASRAKRTRTIRCRRISRSSVTSSDHDAQYFTH